MQTVPPIHFSEYKRKRDQTLKTHNVENKKLCSENDKSKTALHQELEKRLGISATPGPSSPPPASLLPSCPVCFETMKPPLQIFTCGNGHLICSSCKPRATKCFCQAVYMGRATAMEQMVRTILNIQVDFNPTSKADIEIASQSNYDDDELFQRNLLANQDLSSEEDNWWKVDITFVYLNRRKT